MAQPPEARCASAFPSSPSPATTLVLTRPSLSTLAACNKGPWTEEEDQIILERVQQHGTKWAKISGLYLPDRPENDIKNRWHILIRLHQHSQNGHHAPISTLQPHALAAAAHPPTLGGLGSLNAMVAAAAAAENMEG